MLESKQKGISLFFFRARHENIGVYNFTQWYYELPLIIREKIISSCLNKLQKQYTVFSRVELVLIRVMMKLNSFVKKHGKNNIVMLKLIDWMLKKKIVFVVKAGKRFFKVYFILYEKTQLFAKENLIPWIFCWATIFKKFIN